MTDIININNKLAVLVGNDGSEPTLTATPVPDEQRVEFWPQHFGNIPQWITLEPQVFAWMDRFCADYSGGIWNFYTLSNGGAFMVPETDSDAFWSLFNAMNGNAADMSAEAAGIAVCLMTYSPPLFHIWAWFESLHNEFVVARKLYKTSVPDTSTDRKSK